MKSVDHANDRAVRFTSEELTDCIQGIFILTMVSEYHPEEVQFPVPLLRFQYRHVDGRSKVDCAQQWADLFNIDSWLLFHWSSLSAIIISYCANPDKAL